MKVYRHKNYKEYKDAQIEKNIRKLDNVWIREEEIESISKKIKKLIPDVKFGICHGVRNGWEVHQLRDRLGIDIIGTDISPTATQFEHVIEWDFHNVKSEWIDNVDFIYSNSFDHSYDPKKCLDVWMDCIKKPNGICFLHWVSSNVKKLDAADCFSATLDEYRKLINEKYKISFELGLEKRLIFGVKHKTHDRIVKL
jgi:hypothetical protein